MEDVFHRAALTEALHLMSKPHIKNMLLSADKNEIFDILESTNRIHRKDSHLGGAVVRVRKGKIEISNGHKPLGFGVVSVERTSKRKSVNQRERVNKRERVREEDSERESDSEWDPLEGNSEWDPLEGNSEWDPLEGESEREGESDSE